MLEVTETALSQTATDRVRDALVRALPLTGGPVRAELEGALHEFRQPSPPPGATPGGWPKAVIGLVGHDGAGKSSLGRAVLEEAEHRGLTSALVPLALPLKKDLMRLGYPGQAVFAKPTPPEMRALMRAHGAAARAVFGGGYWLDRAWESIAASGADVVVVDDVRHLNEAERIEGAGLLVAVHRLETDPEPDPAHPPIVAEVFGSKALAPVHVVSPGPSQDGRPGMTPVGFGVWCACAARDLVGIALGTAPEGVMRRPKLAVRMPVVTLSPTGVLEPPIGLGVSR